jgi:hypothetical protein
MKVKDLNDSPQLTVSSLSTVAEAQLDRQLRQLREELDHLQASPPVASKLMAAFAARQRKRRLRKHWTHWFAPGLGLAASVGMAAWLTLMPMPPGESGYRAEIDGALNRRPFIALQSLEQIALEPSPQLVEANVPRMLLASYGIPINPETAGKPVRAQILVSAAGQPLALRFAP